MLKRSLGKNGVQVPPLSLACETVHDLPLLQQAVERGITLLNTAAPDPDGQVEERVGRFLAQSRTLRQEISLIAGFDSGGALSARQSLEISLRRLGVERVDILLARGVHTGQLDEPQVAELHQLIHEQKIKAWGISLGPGIGWREEGIEAMWKWRAGIVETQFNLFEQDPGRELCEMAIALRAGVLARLDDKTLIAELSATAVGRQKIALVQQFAADRGMPLASFMVRWILRHRGVVSLTLTLRNQHDLDEALAAVQAPELTSAELTWLATEYARDWGLGEAAHPRDLQSSVDPSGTVRSRYIPPPVLLT